MDGNKLTSHASDNSTALDSLSFSDLVSIQEQQPKSPSPNRAKQYQVSKYDPEFEFTSTNANFNSVVNTIKITSADQLISNGQLRPQALSMQTNQSLITKPPNSSRSLLATNSSSKMSCGKTGNTKKYHEQNKASNHTNKKSMVTRTGFGQKMKSFLSPCRECRDIKQGAVKAQTVPGENLKIY
ncbi:uncharacterized protein LOC109814558 [Cajanus cajan]|uniref:uncharacterized protein LOC109814558 n=1 Tax=Cajanus cajan TaxID=3821 RepID=UPI00098DC217|nr:uncharacterized protein LOC109814558 [Cajanus cajan]